MRALIIGDQPLIVSGLQTLMASLQTPVATSCAESPDAARRLLASEMHFDLVLLAANKMPAEREPEAAKARVVLDFCAEDSDQRLQSRLDVRLDASDLAPRSSACASID